MNIWLGSEKGYLLDYITQKWVKLTGKKFMPDELIWLKAPSGGTDVIGETFINKLASDEGLTVHNSLSNSGLLESINNICSAETDQNGLKPAIIDFYEKTSNYEYEVWSTWNFFFYPFGVLLNRLFSRRLRQLNLPLDPMDTTRGISSEIIKLKDKAGKTVYTVWYRTSKLNKQVIYSGIYATCTLPMLGKKCLKVIFPLPNGSAVVIMSVNIKDDGSLELRSAGEGIGYPGFYFLVNEREKLLVRYLKSMRELIHVFVDEEGVLRADHNLFLWGFRFLKIHYRINQRRYL